MKQYVKKINGKTVIKTRRHIVVKRNGMQFINPNEDLILADGWSVYEPPQSEPAPYVPSKTELLEELMVKAFNEKADTTNEDALYYQTLVYPYDHYVGKSLKTGQLVVYGDRIYRVRQEIAVVLEDQYPSVDTAALYEVIEKEHTGDADDPIPYLPPMEIFNGKYYTQDNVVYLCTRDSGVALSHDLKDLVDVYVSQIE